MGLPTALGEYIGMDKSEIDTPALLIDLDLLEKNIGIVADYYRRKKGSALRPHQKGHRLPVIGKMQLDAGAVGVSMTSFSLAELYVNCGFRDILITSEIYGANKIKRLCSLSKRADVTVGVDNLENVKHLSDAALAHYTRINVAPELYMGVGSCGVEISKAASFVKEIAKNKGVHLKGLWWHQGSLGELVKWGERKVAHFENLDDGEA